MNNKELNGLAKQLLWPILRKENYSIVKSNVSGYEFKKELNGNTLICAGGTYTRPAGLAITSPTYHLSIPKFNTVFNHYFKKFHVDDFENSLLCECMPSEKRQQLFYAMDQLGINSEVTFLEWLDYFKTYMEEIVEPFFEKCTTMKGLNELIETRKNDEDLRISLGTTNAWMKKLFILKLAKNQKYSEYSEWFIKHNTILRTKEEGAWEKYCDACFALYDDLEKGVWEGFEL